MKEIDVDWLESHGFKKLDGMQPVGCGTMCGLSLSKNESIYISISATPDTYGKTPMHMSVKTKYCDATLSKKTFVPDGNGGWNKYPFTDEELFTLLKLTNNEEIITFFE